MSPRAAPGEALSGPPPPWITDGGRDAPMPHPLRYSSLLIVLHAFVLPARSEEAGPRPTTRNVVLVTTDGLRWQEVFRGADDALLNKKDGGVADPDALRRAFWRETPRPAARRCSPSSGRPSPAGGRSSATATRRASRDVTNKKNFSYPGYNELFTGSPDPRIDSNEKRPNPNVSVLEWLHRKPAFRGEVAAVASWDLFPFILNVERSGLTVNAGWMPFGGTPLTESQALLNRLMGRSVHDWENSRNDVLTSQVALEHLRRDTPRVLYVGFGDTDEYAHAGRYDQYLRAAHDADAALKTLWDELQAHPQYRGTTTLIVTTDHGRGEARRAGGATARRSRARRRSGSPSSAPTPPHWASGPRPRPWPRPRWPPRSAPCSGRTTTPKHPEPPPPVADLVQPQGGVPAATPAPPLSRIAFGSCARQDKPQPIWDAVVATKPELFLFLGDNIYADTEDMDVMRGKYAQLGASPGTRSCRRRARCSRPGTTTTTATTTPAPSTRRRPSRSRFPRLLRRAGGLAAAQAGGRLPRRGLRPAGQAGAGHPARHPLLPQPAKKDARAARGEGRYVPNTDPTATMLGRGPVEVAGGAAEEPAELRLIGSSIQVVAEDHGFEKWANFPHERERLFKLIRDTRAAGVVFLSGDRHLAELSLMDGGVGYPLYDLTSSGLNQGRKRGGRGGEPAPRRHDELRRQLRPGHASTGTAPTPGSRSRSATRTARSSSPRRGF